MKKKRFLIMAKKRKWTKEEKLRIIGETQNNTVRKILEDNRLSSSVFYRWVKEQNGSYTGSVSEKDKEKETNSRNLKENLLKKDKMLAQLETELALHKELTEKLSIEEIPLSIRKELVRKYNKMKINIKIKLVLLFKICKVTKRQYYNSSI